jgi:flagellar biosynthesis chaperone FliJ
MMGSWTFSARSARLLKVKSVTVIHLKQQIDTYQTSIKKQSQKVTDLEDELELSRDFITNRSNSLPADIILGDLYHNRNVNPHEW